MIEQITHLQSFGLLLTIVTYVIAKKIESKIKNPMVNTMVIALVIIIPILLLTKTSYETYMIGASTISYFIGPATVCLAISIYKNMDVLKKYTVPLLTGITVGMFLTVLLIGVLCYVFKLPSELTVPFYSKSITTAIAMEVSKILGANPSIAIAFVLMTGVSGMIIGVSTLKLFKINNEIAQGAAFGSAFHAMGVAKAFDLGETQGGIAGLSMGIAGTLGVFIIQICAYILSFFLV